MQDEITLGMIYDKVSNIEKRQGIFEEKFLTNDLSHTKIEDCLEKIENTLTGKGNGHAMSYEVIKKVVRSIDTEDNWTTLKFARAARKYIVIVLTALSVSGLTGLFVWLSYIWSLHTKIK